MVWIRKFKVFINNESSKMNNITNGLPQDSIITLLLFNLHPSFTTEYNKKNCTRSRLLLNIHMSETHNKVNCINLVRRHFKSTFSCFESHWIAIFAFGLSVIFQMVIWVQNGLLALKGNWGKQINWIRKTIFYQNKINTFCYTYFLPIQKNAFVDFIFIVFWYKWFNFDI